MAPGGGAGNLAAAQAQVKACLDVLHKVLGAAPVGSKEYKSVLRALNALQPVFGGAEGGNLTQSAAQQMMTAAKGGQSPMASVAPGLQPAAPAAPSPQPSPEMAA